MAWSFRFNNFSGDFSKIYPVKINSFSRPLPGMKLDTVKDHQHDGCFVGAGGTSSQGVEGG